MSTKTAIPAHVTIEVTENDAFVLGTEITYHFDTERWVMITGQAEGEWHVLVVDDMFTATRASEHVADQAAAEEMAARWLQSWDAGLRG